MPQGRKRERDVQPEVAREALGLVVEHQEDDLPAAVAHQVVRLLVGQEVVADLLDRVERPLRAVARDEHARVVAVE